MSDNRRKLELYGDAHAADDFDGMARYRHPEWRMELPQSGEVFTGNENYRLMRTSRREGRPRLEPGWSDGEGDHFWSEGIVHYANGERWLAVTLYWFRDGLIWRERTYFMQPFPAPPERAQWATRVEPAIR